MKDFTPDYTYVIEAAQRKKPARLPLYEHDISRQVTEAVTGKSLEGLLEGNASDKREYFRIFSGMCRDFGYDVVPYEGLTVELIQKGEGLCGRAPALITSQADLDSFPWKEVREKYFAVYGPVFEALRDTMPEGMKAVAGVGNGLFEVVQDFVPLTDLAYLEADAPDVYAGLWTKVADLLYGIWEEFLQKYADVYAVCRFGDDLGFKSSLLVKPETVREHIIPQYKRIISLIHRYGKPFLLHSCGNIFSIMDDLIDEAGIDAKHSNEDTIAPFGAWVEKYNNRIGLFGGIDMNVLCLNTPLEIKEYVREVLKICGDLPGIAVGSGNQIAEYVPPEGFTAMVEAVREYRGD